MAGPNDKIVAPARFAWPRAAAHWLIALLVLFLLGSGFFGLAAAADTDPAMVDILRAHMIAGAAALAMIALYIAAMLRWARPAKATSRHALLDALATTVHVALPLTVLVMIASGVATVQAAGLADIVFGGTADHLPATVTSLPSFRVHMWAARVTLLLLALHAVGALYHQLVLRDGLIGRILPWRRTGA